MNLRAQGCASDLKGCVFSNCRNGHAYNQYQVLFCTCKRTLQPEWDLIICLFINSSVINLVGAVTVRSMIDMATSDSVYADQKW